MSTEQTTDSHPSRGFLKALAALLALLVLAVTALLLTLRFQPAQLTPVVEAALEYALEREVTVGELVEVKLGRDSYLIARDLAVANPEWAAQPHMGQLDRLDVGVYLPSLWGDGPLIVRDLEIGGLRVDLQTNAEGQGNWEFDFGDEDEETEDEGPLFPVIIQRAHVEGGALSYRGPEQAVELGIDQVTVAVREADALTDLELSGEVNGIPLHMAGVIGPEIALQTGLDLVLDLDARLGDLQLEADGRIADLERLAGADLKLEIKAPRSRPLLDILSLQEVRDGPLSFHGRVIDTGSGLEFSASGFLAEFELKVAGSIEDPAVPDGVDVDIALSGPSMAEAGRIFGVAGLKDVPYDLTGKVQRRGDLLAIRDGKLRAAQGELTISGEMPNFPEIDDWQVTIAGRRLDLSILGPMIGVEGLPTELVDIDGGLSADVAGAEFVDMRVTGENVQMVLNGSLGDPPDYMDSTLEAQFRMADVSVLGPLLGLEQMPAEAVEFSGRLAIYEDGWRLENARLESSQLKLAVEGSMDSLVNPQKLVANVSFNTRDLTATLGDFGVEVSGLKPAAFRISGDVSLVEDGFEIQTIEGNFGDLPFSGSGIMRDTDGFVGSRLALKTVGADLARLVGPLVEQPLPAEPFNLAVKLALAADGIEVSGLQGELGGAQFAAQGLLSDAEALAGSRLSLQASGPDLARFVGPLTDQALPAEPFRLVLDTTYHSPLLSVERLEASLGQHRLTGKLSLKELSEGSSRLSGPLSLEGESLENLLALAGYEVGSEEEHYRLSTTLEADEHHLVLGDLQFAGKHSDLSGRASVQFGDIPNLEARLHSNVLYLPFIMPSQEEIAEAGEQESAASGDESSDFLTPPTKAQMAQRMIPDTELPLDWMKSINAALRYDVNELYLRQDAHARVALDATLQDGALTTRQLAWDGPVSHGEAAVTVDTRPAASRMELHINSSRLPLVWFFAGHGKPTYEAEYRAHLSAEGATLRQVAASLDGALLFRGSGIQVSNQGLDLVMGATLEAVFDRMNPYSVNEAYTELECHAGAIHFDKGLMEMIPGMTFRSDKMDILVSGVVDLRDESLGITFNSRPRKGLGLSAGKAVTPYLKLAGNLSYPFLTVDPEAVVIMGGAAIATGGLSMLAENLWSRWKAATENPCKQIFVIAAKDSSRGYKQRFPEALK